MAAPRRNAMLIEEARRKIQTTQLINRLTKHALSDEPIMDSSQVKACETLLRKSVPDLQAIALTGADGVGPVTIEIVRYADPASK